MLDMPEIYFENEYELLSEIKKGEHWNIIYSLWSIRKINWNIQSMIENPSTLNRIKKERAIRISLLKILRDPDLSLQNLKLSDFSFLNKISLCRSARAESCYYSRFLETHHSQSLNLILDEEEFLLFDELMPGEGAKNSESELKKSITAYEILITKTSIRTDEASFKMASAKYAWLEKLSK